ncbi:hypothetical protein Bbelb_067630 [Branchiostoma belcheri]|nr:hypothetical protein Bbelb_067630 [Branchiostoma belcheri]
MLRQQGRHWAREGGVRAGTSRPGNRTLNRPTETPRPTCLGSGQGLLSQTDNREFFNPKTEGIVGLANPAPPSDFVGTPRAPPSGCQQNPWEGGAVPNPHKLAPPIL